MIFHLNSKTTLRLFLAGCFVVVYSIVCCRYGHALGLGSLEVDSKLNEPLSGRISLVSPRVEELDSLRVRVADHEAFGRAGIERHFILSSLRFELVRPESDEADYIRISSITAIQEPVLNLVLEVLWEQGRLQRTYTIILDPPVNYEQSQQMTATPTVSAPVEQDWSEPSVEFELESEPEMEPEIEPAVPVDAAEIFASDSYGPVNEGETLWSIANRMRPSGVSNQRMMIALLQTNPDSFIDNNINLLRKESILNVPSSATLNALDEVSVREEIDRQNQAWSEFVPDTPVMQQPETVSELPATVPSEEVTQMQSPPTGEPELRVLAPESDADLMTGVQENEEGVFADAADMEEKLLLAVEEMDVLAQENEELRSRLQELEELSSDQRTLIELRDEQLAALQNRLNQLAEEPMVEEEIMEEPMAEEEIMAEPMVEEEIMAEPMVEEEIMAEPMAEEEIMAEPMVEEEIMAEPMAEEEIMEEPMAEEEIMEEPMAEEEIMAEPMVEEEVMEEPMMAEPIEEESPDMMTKAMNWMNKAKVMIEQQMSNPLVRRLLLGIFGLLILIIVVIKIKNRPRKISSFDDEATIKIPTGKSFDDYSDDTDMAGDAESNAHTKTGSEVAIETSPSALDATGETMASIVDEEEEEEEDHSDDESLRNVDTYLAYEQYEQAELAVRELIIERPRKAHLWVKLLEIFYTAGDKRKYEEAAAELQELVNGKGEHWDMALAMWSEMSTIPLFESGDIAEQEEESSTDTGGGLIDITAVAEGEEEASGGLDFDFSEEESLSTNDGIDTADEETGTVDEEADADAEAYTVDEEADADDQGIDTGSDTLAEEEIMDATDDYPMMKDETSDTGDDIVAEEDSLDMQRDQSLIDLDEEDDVMDITPPSDTDPILTLADEEQAEEEDVLANFEFTDSGVETLVDTKEGEEDVESQSGEEMSLDAQEIDDLSTTDESQTLDTEDVMGNGALDLTIEGEDDDDEGLLNSNIHDTNSEGDLLDVTNISSEEDEGTDTTSDSSDNDGYSMDDSFSETADETWSTSKNDSEILEKDDEEQSGDEDITNQLDLARAYVELGEENSARAALEEVMAKGNDEQRKQAEELLARL